MHRMAAKFNYVRRFFTLHMSSSGLPLHSQSSSGFYLFRMRSKYSVQLKSVQYFTSTTYYSYGGVTVWRQWDILDV